jgi:hypothetical protein
MPIKRFAPIGVTLDVDPINVSDEVWTESLNMVPRPGAMNRAKGYAPALGDPIFPPTFVMSAPQLGEPWWVYGGESGLASINTAFVHTDITPASLTAPVPENGWTGGNLNGIACLNNFDNGPYYWFNGIVGGIALDMPGQRANTRYQVMRPFKYHLFGLGVSDGSGTFTDQLHWSDGADPGQIPATWVPDPSNEAGDNILADESGAIIDGLALRDAFYIYKQDSVYEATYVGGTRVFNFRKVFGTTGVLTRNCVVRVKGTHVVLGNGDIYQHDGQNIRSLVDGKLRRTFFSTLSDENFENSFCVYLEPKEEVWFCVPTTGKTVPNLALVWNVATDQFGYRIIPPTDFAGAGPIGEQQGLAQWDNETLDWASRVGGWIEGALSETEDSIILASKEEVKLYLADSGRDADGVAYRSTIGKLSMQIDEPGREKAVRRIWPHINAPAGTVFTMQLFNQKDPQANFQQVALQDFVHPTEHGIAVNVNARYLGMRLWTEESVDWDIGAYDVEYRNRGAF